MSQQLTLRMFKTAKADDAEVRFLVEYLHRHGGWLTAAQIYAYTRWNNRKIRELAEASKDKIISGQLGYKHVENATAEETHHFVVWMESQGRKMIARAEAVRRLAHQLVG